MSGRAKKAETQKSPPSGPGDTMRRKKGNDEPCSGTNFPPASKGKQEKKSTDKALMKKEPAIIEKPSPRKELLSEGHSH